MDKFISQRPLNWRNNRTLPPSAFLKIVSRHCYNEDDSSVFTCRFHSDYRSSNIFAFCKDNGEICCGNTRLAKFSPNDFSVPMSNIIVKCFQADDNAIIDCQWQPAHGTHIFAASGNGTVLLWDLEERKLLSKFSGHVESVKCLSVCPDEPYLVVSGSRDGSVLLWDIREGSACGQPVRTIRNAHVTIDRTKLPRKRRSSCHLPPAVTVSAVLLHDRQTVISGSSKRSGIRFWDLRKIYSRTSTTPPVPCRLFSMADGPKEGAGFTSFSTDPYGRHTLYASCTDNLVHAYSLTSLSTRPVRYYQGASISSFDVNTAICPTLPYLLCGSSNGKALIWSLDSDKPSFMLKSGHRTGIYAAAWNDQFELLTFSNDCWRVWKVIEYDITQYHRFGPRCVLYDEISYNLPHDDF